MHQRVEGVYINHRSKKDKIVFIIRGTSSRISQEIEDIILCHAVAKLHTGVKNVLVGTGVCYI